MPLINERLEKGGYLSLIEQTFKPLLEEFRDKKKLPKGGIAVIYDKNYMEASGYAATMADFFDEPVYLARCLVDASNPPVRFRNGILYVRVLQGKWLPIRAALRYVTQKPWNRIPVVTKTAMLNPVLVCLAGGRNKMLAAKAYQFFNAEMEGTGLVIRTPETFWNISKEEVPLWVENLGGFAVVKNPNSNAGQGVYTITNQTELQKFMDDNHTYNKFIVQNLIGNANWTSFGREKRLYHVGTVPNKHNQLFTADLRMMIHYTSEGFRPLAIYTRRARRPLEDSLDLMPDHSSWDILGTNLSVKRDGEWTTETKRLLLMDQRDFNRIGIGLDDLIEAFIQTVLATTAIDKMAKRLMSSKRKFQMKLFRSIHPDKVLIEEVLQGQERKNQ